MAGVGEPPVEDKPPKTSRPTAFLWHLLVQVAVEGGKAIGADVAVKNAGNWIRRRGKQCPEHGKPVKKTWKHCPKCGKKMPRPPALHP